MLEHATIRTARQSKPYDIIVYLKYYAVQSGFYYRLELIVVPTETEDFKV